jgi:cation:H+ antiporter
MTYIYLVIGLILVIKSADLMVEGASSIARKFRISDFVIGLTVVSFGTSLPELIIALFSSEEGAHDFITGNVVGSNIANILLVLGVAATINPLPATNRTVWREIPFTLIASLIFWVLAHDQWMSGSSESALSRMDGVVLLVCFSGFIVYAYSIVRRQQKLEHEWEAEVVHHSSKRSTIEIIAGIVGLYIGGWLAVDLGAKPIAEAWGMSEGMIGLTVIAIGTSLPELATSAVASFKKNTDIAVGNVVGSNIFNIFIVLGITSTLNPIPFNPKFNTDIVIMLAATLILFVSMFVGTPRRTIHRGEGILFLAMYVAYIVFVVIRG